MVILVKKSVYPNGSFVEYERGMVLEAKPKAPNTEEINKWFKEIHKNFKKPIRWKKNCR